MMTMASVRLRVWKRATKPSTAPGTSHASFRIRLQHSDHHHPEARVSRRQTPQLRHVPTSRPSPQSGLLGITAACCGAHVTMTDRAEMLQLARRNAAANGALVNRAGGSLEVQELDWGDAGSEIMAGPWDVVLGKWRRGLLQQ